MAIFLADRSPRLRVGWVLGTNRDFWVQVGLEWRIGFFAQRDVAVDEELCIAYGWESRYEKQRPCTCRRGREVICFI
jgi:hypothetical protein